MQLQIKHSIAEAEVNQLKEKVQYEILTISYFCFYFKNPHFCRVHHPWDLTSLVWHLVAKLEFRHMICIPDNTIMHIHGSESFTNWT